MNVLIVKLTSMGDLVQALPAISDARRARPDVVFDWVVDEAFAEIPGWHPAVRQVIKTAHRRWKSDLWGALRRGELKAFWRQLRTLRYDAVIDAQTNLKSAAVTALTRGPRHGPDRSSVREFPAHWVYGHHYEIDTRQLAVERWRQLFAKVLGYPVPGTSPDFGIGGNSWPAVSGLPEQPFIVVVPSASWPNKHWLDEHWRTLIARAGDAGFAVVLTWGSEAEFKRASAIASQLENAHVLPRHTLTELAAILQASVGAICMDTGLAHVSAALDVPTVTLYGPTDPALIGATGGRSRHVVAGGYPCIPCYRKDCAVGDYRGPQAQCLAGVQPGNVWSEFTDLLEATA